MSESDRAEFKRQIEEQSVQLIEDFKRGDVKACASIYTSDVIALYPGSPPIRGRDALASSYQSLLDAGVKMTGMRTEQYDCDDRIGYAVLITQTNRGDVASLTAFRKGDDGIWLACSEAVPSAPSI